VAERKGLAITALALGLLGLFSGGLLGVGSLLGLILAVVALVQGPPQARRDVAWAAIAANVFALLTLLPLSMGYWAYRASPVASFGGDDSLPEPVKPLGSGEAWPDVLPPPPPPAPGPRPTAPSSGTPTPPIARPRGRSPKAGGPGAEGPAPVVPVRVGGAIQEPKKIRHVAPAYPRPAVESRVQGVVVLECTISPKGKIVEIKVLRSVPPLDEAAVEAVRQWEYTPTLLDGVPVPVIMTVTVNFKLN
jgi:protein TonB